MPYRSCHLVVEAADPGTCGSRDLTVPRGAVSPSPPRRTVGRVRVGEGVAEPAEQPAAVVVLVVAVVVPVGVVVAVVVGVVPVGPVAPRRALAVSRVWLLLVSHPPSPIRRVPGASG